MLAKRGEAPELMKKVASDKSNYEHNKPVLSGICPKLCASPEFNTTCIDCVDKRIKIGCESIAGVFVAMAGPEVPRCISLKFSSHCAVQLILLLTAAWQWRRWTEEAPEGSEKRLLKDRAMKTYQSV